jgi:hypothetical protein
MMHRGYIKLWRKSFDSGLHRDHKTWALWTYILCQATYKEIDININGEIVHLIPGQMITGRKKLAKELHMSERGIRTRLNHLKNYGNLTIKTTNRFSIINVINWNVYQQDESQNDQPNDQQATSKRPASDHKQEVKKVKKEKNKDYTDDFLKFWKAYPKKIGKGAAYKSWLKIKPNNGTLALIIAAVKNQQSCDQWCRDNGQFIPHPATWLNQSRWEDEVEKVEDLGAWREKALEGQ